MAWELTYTTISDRSRRVSQRAFLRNLARGEAYLSEAPTMWDVDMQTAVAQAEMEDRPTAGAYHRLLFHRPGGADIEIDTTRPELLAACVAVVVHPDDARWRDVVGTEVVTPLVRRAGPDGRPPAGRPREGHRRRDDLHLRRQHRRRLVARARPAARARWSSATAGCRPRCPEWVTADAGVRAWDALAGKTTKAARTARSPGS